jgi:serine/threonine-protein kinase
MGASMAEAGQLIGNRYRLEKPLAPPSDGGALQGRLWLASDQLAADAPVALRQIGPEQDQQRARELWGRLQGLLHPQLPRFGPALNDANDLWLVREWLQGPTYQHLLAARAERQLVFGAGEVLLLLRQLLPVIAALHGQDLLHGDLTPANLVRRDSDGLPVLLDFGLARGSHDPTPSGATPGYAPPELARGEPAEPWMDLHALGVVALVLLSGQGPAALMDPVSLDWRWPASLDQEPALRSQLERLLQRESGGRFASAAEALEAFQRLAMPDSTGPVPRADRTVMLVPPPAPAAAPTAVPPEPPAPPVPPVPEASAKAEPEPEPAPPPEPPAPAAPQSTEPEPQELRYGPSDFHRRSVEREEAAEGGLWPVLIALVLSAIVGTALGWWWLGRGSAPNASPGLGGGDATSSLPPSEVDQRQQLLNRLRALQVDRDWFLRLVDASLLAQYPERHGRLPSDALDDQPLRKVWNELAEEWLARVEQLPLPIRQQLGSFNSGDWERRKQSLVQQGLSPEVLRQLVSASAQNLLPSQARKDLPPEPFRQLWYAAAEQTLANVRIEPIEVPSQSTQLISTEIPASGARLFPIRIPAGHGLALGVNGTPLLQMSVFGADGSRLESKGPLRVVTLGVQKASPVQLLITNEGVAPAQIRLSLRADPAPPPPKPDTPSAPNGAPVPTEPAATPPEGTSAPTPPSDTLAPGAEPAAPAAPANPAPAAPPPPTTP